MAARDRTLLIGVLRRIRDHSSERVFFSDLFENLAPGERPVSNYKGWSLDEQKAIRAGIDIGLLRQTEERPPEEAYGPDYVDYYVSLTGLGYQYLMDEDRPWHERARSQISRNLLTILISLLVAITTGVVSPIAVALISHELGLNTPSAEVP